MNIYIPSRGGIQTKWFLTRQIIYAMQFFDLYDKKRILGNGKQLSWEMAHNSSWTYVSELNIRNCLSCAVWIEFEKREFKAKFKSK